MTIDDRLSQLGIELPPVAAPVASYVPVVVSNGFAFVSGQVPLEEGKPIYQGRLGAEVSVEEGMEAARRCALQSLAALEAELGSLDRVRRIVKLTVWVASTDSFTDQPRVANGASDLLGEIFGDAGRHARAAVSAPALPLGVPVEVEVVAEVSEGDGRRPPGG
jgi:enamine deaminase RidA (YjgF/YER057c/UK114 family)